jgi:hypothetical protein
MKTKTRAGHRRTPATRTPPALPKFWRTNLTSDQKLDCKLIHWDLIERFSTGTAGHNDLWDWMETGFTYGQLARLLVRDGVPLNPEAMAAINAQHAIYETVAQRFARTDRAAFTPQELVVARAAAAVFDDLVELDRNGLAKEAALWSMAQMQAIGRDMRRSKA